MFEAKNELLLAVSHELRTPLARMQVSLAMSCKDKHTKKIAQDIQHMEQLIEQLVEGERLRAGHQALHLTNNYLPALIDDLLAESVLFQRIQLIGEVPDVVLSVDVGRFKFLIRNLLNNALKHNSDDVECRLEITADDHNLTLVVADQGQGISKAAQRHLFEPFYSVNKVAYRDAKGIGLGLCLCKSIVEAHGGSIEVESELGQGTRFVVILPVCQS
nr:HAMP domain-containing sensor histidine kinase [Pseudoalteromonas caenipelagi]